MPRAKQGNKAARKERNRAFQNKLKERKRLRKQRAAEFAHLPGQQATLVQSVNTVKEAKPTRSEVNRAALRASLKEKTVSDLRQMAKDRNLPVRSRDRKNEIIALLVAAS